MWNASAPSSKILFDETSKLGVIDIHESNEAHTLIIEKFIKAKTTIKTMNAMVFGGSGLKAMLQKKEIERALMGNDTKIQILAAHPCTDLMQDIANLEGEESRIKNGATGIFECVEKYNETAPKSKSKSKIDLIYSEKPIFNAMILINDQWGFLTLSLPPTFGTNTMSIEFENTNDQSLFAIAQCHFDAIWDKSSDVHPADYNGTNK
jgi:hypothetical protein